MSAWEVFVGARPRLPSREATNIKRKEQEVMEHSKPRVVGLDVHPDSFAGAILEGSDPWSAHVVRTSTRVALTQLEAWATRQTSAKDVLVPGSERQRLRGGGAAAHARKKGGDPRQSSRGEDR